MTNTFTEKTFWNLVMKHLLKVIWEALHDYRENCIPESDPMYDEQWEEICYVMAKLEEQYND